MPRTAAKVTQADIARAARVARQVGGLTVEVAPDGTIRLVPMGQENATLKPPQPAYVGERPVM